MFAFIVELLKLAVRKAYMVIAILCHPSGRRARQAGDPNKRVLIKITSVYQEVQTDYAPVI